MNIQTICTFCKLTIFSVRSCAIEYSPLLAMAPFLVENLKQTKKRIN